MVFVVMTDEGETLGVAASEEIAIRKMIEHLTWHKEHNHWFETEEEFEEAIADIKLNLQQTVLSMHFRRSFGVCKTPHSFLHRVSIC